MKFKRSPLLTIGLLLVVAACTSPSTPAATPEPTAVPAPPESPEPEATKSEDSGIQSLVDLEGKVVGAARGTTSIDNLRAEADRLEVRLAVVEVDDHEAGLQELVAGTVDAYTTDATILAGLANRQPGLVVVGGPFSSEPYGLGVPSGDSQFRDLVNFTLQDLYLDGTYETLYRTWLLGGSPDGINVGGEVFQMEIWPAGNLSNYILGK